MYTKTSTKILVALTAVVITAMVILLGSMAFTEESVSETRAIMNH